MLDPTTSAVEIVSLSIAKISLTNELESNHTRNVIAYIHITFLQLYWILIKNEDIKSRLNSGNASYQ
jgi:hypothetical protein